MPKKIEQTVEFSPSFDLSSEDSATILKEVYAKTFLFLDQLPKKAKNTLVIKVEPVVYSVVEDLFKELNLKFKYPGFEEALTFNLRPSVRASLNNNVTKSFAKLNFEVNVSDKVKDEISLRIETAQAANKNLTTACIRGPAPVLTLIESLCTKHNVGVVYPDSTQPKKVRPGLGHFSARVTKGVNTIRNALPEQGKGISFADIFENTDMADILAASSMSKEDALKTFGGYSLKEVIAPKKSKESLEGLKAFFLDQKAVFDKGALESEIDPDILDALNKAVPVEAILKVHTILIERAFKVSVKKPTLFDAVSVYARVVNPAVSSKEIILSFNKILLNIDKIRKMLNA